MFRGEKYDLDFKNPSSDPGLWLNGDEMIRLYHEYIAAYPMVSIEDPFDQDHWEAWSKLTASTSIQVLIWFNFF